MLSNMHAHVRSKLRFGTMIVCFACVSAMMGRVLTRKSYKKVGAPDTGGCPESANVRNRSAHDWISGAKPGQARKLS